MLLAALAACSSSDPPPQPMPRQAPERVPVVADVQADRVQTAVEAALAEADETLDPAPLAPRVTGSALELRQARYIIRRQLPDQAPPEVLSGERVLDIVPATEGWPRYYLSVTRADEAAVPQILVMTQAGPRDPYQLTTYATLLPGVTLPPTPPADEGSEALDPGERSGLVATPADVVARYADVLAEGEGSEFAEAFGEDAFSTQVQGEQAAESEAVSAFYGYSVTHVPRQDAVWALRTSDGGAIVVGVIDSTRTFAVTTPGAMLPLPADLAVLAGKPVAGDSASVSSTEVVAVAVPPEDGEAPLQVIAAARGAVGAQAP
jgi:hypothetical protein